MNVWFLLWTTKSQVTYRALLGSYTSNLELGFQGPNNKKYSSLKLNRHTHKHKHVCVFQFTEMDLEVLGPSTLLSRILDIVYKWSYCYPVSQSFREFPCIKRYLCFVQQTFQVVPRNNGSSHEPSIREALSQKLACLGDSSQNFIQKI